MKLISHRGNINGRNIQLENTISYIIDAINNGYDVEIDIWLIEKEWYLGHDAPDIKINFSFIEEYNTFLWLHCKNKESIEFFNNHNVIYNYFFHISDNVTLTSKNIMWVFPRNQPIKNSIAVLPELYDDDISQCFGICSDYVSNY